VGGDGTEKRRLDQSATADEWVSLGTHRFEPGANGYVEITNEEIDESGSMYAGAARFERVDEAADE